MLMLSIRSLKIRLLASVNIVSEPSMPLLAPCHKDCSLEASCRMWRNNVECRSRKKVPAENRKVDCRCSGFVEDSEIWNRLLL